MEYERVEMKGKSLVDSMEKRMVVLMV